ncbi:hypothetical protein L2725_21365 [Shewanella corallii]|uniref:DUF2066 domain-containing protein n=1 Tax=Shewanella corallii TaxID=560080 RepID=A0ABT0NCS7_9GAMM|nr:hypothetical protein [Shewanella corallii]MCL2916288.1 hypothetical protein [Shewanella corallii]
MKPWWAVALCLPLSAMAGVVVNSQGQLEVEACAYGRGQVAIAGARDMAAAELAEFVRGAKVLEQVSGAEYLSEADREFYRSERQVLLQGLSAGAIPLSIGSPRIQGGETCVPVYMALEHASDGELVWDDESPTATVTVMGEGWPARGRSAMQNAEQDAFARAVSQVAGVWLNQQRSHSSMLAMSIQDERESNSLNEMVGQQLQSRTSGIISEWQLLASEPLSNNGVRVTIMAVVDKTPLAAGIQDLLSSVGSPRIALVADGRLKEEIGTWLTGQGIEVSDRAPLVLETRSELIPHGNNVSLHISLHLRDYTGNIYGRWENEPHLMTLPNKHGVESRLTQAHLSSEANLESLAAALQSAFERVVAQGGIMRQLRIPRDILSQPQQLQGLLNALAGVKGASVQLGDAEVVANMRYSGSSSDLASQVHHMLLAAATGPLPEIEIRDDYILFYR